MQNDAAMANFYCLVNKTWKKISYIVIRKEKAPGLYCFLSAKS